MKILKSSQYPKSIKIRSSEYKIKFKKMSDCYGVCHNDGNIFIDPRQSKSEILKTLIHELCHGIEYEYNIKLKHKNIYVLERAIYKILKDNF